jgi:ubiquinone/menaquinone biosynthesis C-methylase UbiE
MYQIESLIKGLELQNSYILDVGTGIGNCVAILGTSEKTFAIDLSIDMLAIAKKRHAEVHFAKADAFALPFASGTFKLIFAIGLMEYLSDISSFFISLSSCLTPDGYLIVTSSPPGIFTSLRTLLGHKIYTIPPDNIVATARACNLSTQAVRYSKTQTVFLMKPIANNSKKVVDSMGKSI